MRIVIVDDHPLVRQGLISVLEMEDDMKVISESDNALEALSIISDKKPDIALIDLMLGKESGLEIVKKAKELKISSKFIILTSSAYYEDFLMAEACGVEGYILKEALPEELLYAIRLVNGGRRYYDPQLLEYKLRQGTDGFYEQLTAREQEVLRELGKGLNNRQIAKRLFITEHTVKKHVSQILAKLGLEDRTQAALYINNMNLRYTS
ncbi:MAG: response regulator transcription factor [Clostridiales bacterium]|nr:response regulator transcription factor [Clostridiales bacterium]